MRKTKAVVAAFALCIAGASHAGIFSKKNQENERHCDLSAIGGDAFTFKKASSSGGQYNFWFDSLGPGEKRLGESKYLGINGKLTKEKTPTHGGRGFYQKAILENCQTVYALVMSAAPDAAYGGIYFASEVDAAKKLINTTIWIDASNTVKNIELLTDNPQVSYETYNTEPVQVTGVVVDYLAHAPYYGPLFLKVKRNSGEEGLLPLIESWIHKTYPLPSDTQAQVRKAIENKEIHIGMTEVEARLSWGKPKSVNKSVGAWGTKEQWVYGRQYLYFENGRMTSFQSSE